MTGPGELDRLDEPVKVVFLLSLVYSRGSRWGSDPLRFGLWPRWVGSDCGLGERASFLADWLVAIEDWERERE